MIALRLASVFCALLVILSAGCDTFGTGKGPSPERSFIKYYGNQGNDGQNRQRAMDMITTPEGGFVLVGFSNAFDPGEDDLDGMIVQTDAAGNANWVSTFGGAGEELACAVVAASGGGYLVVGAIEQGGQSDVALWRISDKGDLQWTRTYGSPASNEVGSSLISTSDGAYLVIGSSDENGHSDTYSVKIDGNGDLLWPQARIYGSPTEDSAVAVIETPQGFSLLATSGFTEQGQARSNLLFLELNENGVPLDFRILGADLDETAAAMIEGPQGFSILGNLRNDPLSDGQLFLVNDLQNSQDPDIEAKVITDGQTPISGRAASLFRRSNGDLAILATQRGNIQLLLTDPRGESPRQEFYGELGPAQAAKVLELDDGALVILGTVSFGNTRMMSLIKTYPNGQLKP